MTRTGSFDLVVKVYPEGRMSRMLDEIPIGRAITVRGPQGHYDHPEADAGKDLIMIAGGVGITTCFQFFQSAFNDEIRPRSIHLLYSSRFEDEIVFTNELMALQQANPDRFHVHFTITRVCVSLSLSLSLTPHDTDMFLSLLILQPSEEWQGLKGRIDAQMWQKLMAPTVPTTKAFVCGDEDFLVAMKQIALGLGFPPSDLVLL